MIPIELSIQGLYSYQEKQTIDFKRLTASGLFGIFGQVGSGKSSILEAITFAIYGRTDRLNLSGDNRYYNMMNLKSNELLIDFVFETGKDQTAYRAVVKGKRSAKHFDEVKTPERTAYKMSGKDWLPVQPEQLETAIGLSYENFKRTIIIPQGQFQEFLQLGATDRTRMMKELFNLDKFEFYHKISSLENRNNSFRQSIDGQLQQLGACTIGQVETFAVQLEQINSELLLANQKHAETLAREEAWRNLQELSHKVTQSETELKNLIGQEPVIQQLRLKLGRYEQALMQFKPLLDSIQTASEKVTSREKLLSQDEATLMVLEIELAGFSKRLEEVKPDFDRRELLIQRADDLNTLKQIKTLEQNLLTDSERLVKGNGLLEQVNRQIELLRINIDNQNELVRTTRNQLPDLALLSEIKAWHVERTGLEKQIAETHREFDDRRKDLESLDQLMTQIHGELLFEGLSAEADFETRLSFLQEKSVKINDQLKHLNDQKNQLLVKVRLKSYSEGLEEGQPCPLCGSLHHPDMYEAGDLSAVQHQMEQDISNLEQCNTQVGKIREQLNLLEIRKTGLLDQSRQLVAKQELQNEQLDRLMSRFVWEKYRDEQELTRAFDEAEQLKKIIVAAESDLEKLAKQKLEEDQKKERYRSEIEKIRTSITVNQTELITRQGQMRHIAGDQYQNISVGEIDKERTKLLARAENLEKEYNLLAGEISTRSSSRDILAGRLMVNRQELEQELSVLSKLNQQLEIQLGQSEFASLPELQALLAENMNIDLERQRIERFNQMLISTRTQHETLAREIGDRVYLPVEHQATVQERDGLKREIDQKNQEQGRLVQQLEQLKKDLNTRERLQNELANLDIRAENIKTLKTLFKASGFVNYISSVYLQNLCLAANDRFFRLTRQKLSLEMTADNNFQIRDFMNGGKVRSVKTLSGGQVFQASLSLALALADNIQKITESNQNFFFLDEGFGSLDREALTIVFETLKALRKENRIVGVISHVEEMQQEIEVHLRISNDEEKGSLISPGWDR